MSDLNERNPFSRRGMPGVMAFGGAGGGGASTLNGITAATANQAGINSANFNVVWNWKKTSNNETAFAIGESTASTGGTSTANVPNQVLHKISTLAASTASPLSVYSRGSHVFSVSPTSVQILSASGNGGGAPLYSFTANPAAGMFGTAGGLGLTANAGSTARLYLGGTQAILAGVIQDGSYTGNGDVCVFSEGGTGLAELALQRFQSNTNGSAIQGYKSRGNALGPTVITTGDALFAMGGFGYVGGTNTFLEAARIQMTSTGAIADATNGIGSIVSFKGTTAGTDVGPQDTVIITGGSTATFQFKGSGMSAANGVVATVLGSLGPAGSNTTVQEWLKVTLPSGNARFIPCF